MVSEDSLNHRQLSTKLERDLFFLQRNLDLLYLLGATETVDLTQELTEISKWVGELNDRAYRHADDYRKSEWDALEPQNRHIFQTSKPEEYL